MTWTNRFRLFGGLLAVLVLVAVLTLVFNHRQTQAQSLTATVKTDSYDVGASYGGTVVEQNVKENDSVAVGEDLFTMQSPQLQQDIANDIEVADTGAYDVNEKKGTITYKGRTYRHMRPHEAAVRGIGRHPMARLPAAYKGGRPGCEGPPARHLQRLERGLCARRRRDTGLGELPALVARTSKNAEVFMKLANDMFAPLSTRASVAMERLNKAA